MPICLLNGDRFLKVKEIYSEHIPDSFAGHQKFFDSIDISEFLGVFDIEAKNKEWQKYSAYYPYLLRIDNINLF